METLHLIVHKSMIEEELKSDLTPDEKKPKLEKVLRRIQEIETTEENVKYIVFDNDNPNNLDGIHHTVDICRGYSSVVLYGISTTVCLPFVERKLKEKGFIISYDQQGTID